MTLKINKSLILEANYNASHKTIRARMKEHDRRGEILKNKTKQKEAFTVTEGPKVGSVEDNRQKKAEKHLDKFEPKV